MIIVKKKKNSVFRTSISNSLIFFELKQRKIGHLFHDKLRDRKSQDFVKAISTYTLYLYLTGSWTNSSLGLQWKYSKNIQNSQSEIKQNSFFLQTFSASKAPTWRWLPCYPPQKKTKKKKKEKKKKKLSLVILIFNDQLNAFPLSLFMRCGSTCQK